MCFSPNDALIPSDENYINIIKEEFTDGDLSSGTPTHISCSNEKRNKSLIFLLQEYFGESKSEQDNSVETIRGQNIGVYYNKSGRVPPIVDSVSEVAPILVKLKVACRKYVY